MTVRASFDEGPDLAGEARKSIRDSAAYSCLAQLPDGRIGLLYEQDDYRQIVFDRRRAARDLTGEAN